MSQRYFNKAWQVAIGVILAARMAPAFTSCPPLVSSPVSLFTPRCVTGHYEITIAGAAGLGFSWAALTRVADADIGVDARETHFSLPGSRTAAPVFSLYDTPYYTPKHHFDHPPGLTHSVGITEDQQAFLNARSYVLEQRDMIVAALGSGQCDRTEDALDALGRALHAIQDLYSHSNYVDRAFSAAGEGLTVAEQTTIDSAVTDSSIQPPSSLLLTLYGPGAAVAENPTAYCNGQYSAVYCHQYWAKDNPGKNPISSFNNNSVYIAASQAAQNATTRFIRQIVSAVGQSTWNNLVGNYGTGNTFCQQPPCSQMYSACNPKSINGEFITSGDPNEKVGNQGVGSPRFLPSSQPLSYAIYFDNEASATAPAQRVVVTDQLSPSLVDLTTLGLGPISFVDNLVTPPPARVSVLGNYSTDVDLRPSKSLIVRITAALNQAAGVLTWSFTSLDPTTMQPTTDPLAGFLPPGTEASVSFTVVPKAPSTGVQITNKARVTFDLNPPMDTPVWSNTFDTTKPTSHVNALAATQPTGTFPVSWMASDVGAGVQDVSVYVSDNGGPFTIRQNNTTATGADFTGIAGHSYASIALPAIWLGMSKVQRLQRKPPRPSQRPRAPSMSPPNSGSHPVVSASTMAPNSSCKPLPFSN